AEDGIRDGHVTGVQTCALPIYGLVPDVFVNSHCFTGDTPVSMLSGVSRRIDSLTRDHRDQVWGWNNSFSGITAEPQYGLQSQGLQSIIEITLLDGRKLRC